MTFAEDIFFLMQVLAILCYSIKLQIHIFLIGKHMNMTELQCTAPHSNILFLFLAFHLYVRSLRRELLVAYNILYSIAKTPLADAIVIGSKLRAS